MSSAARNLPALETSEMWKKSVSLAEHARRFAQTLPPQENYSMASTIIQVAISVTSDVAMAIGKGEVGADFDYRYARGHLFTVKGLALLAEKQGFGQKVRSFLAEITTFEELLDAKIVAVEEADKQQRETEAKKGAK